jgi:aminopeptidase N
MNQKQTLAKTLVKTGLLKALPFIFSFSIACSPSKITISNPESGTGAEKVKIQSSASTAKDPLVTELERSIESYQSTSTRVSDIIHTDLDLFFDWENQAVKGEARLTVKPHFYSQREVELDAKDFEIHQVGIIQLDTVVKLAYRYDEKKLKIYLPEEKTQTDTFSIYIKYTAFPERNSGNGSEAITDTKGLYFIDPLDTVPDKPTMIWTQGETEHNSKWFPTIDKPNERFTQTLRLTVPDSMVTVSNGKLVSQRTLEDGNRQDTWEMDLPHAPYLVALAIGDFGKVENQYGEIPLGYFVEKGFEAGAKIVFQHTPEMMAYFEKLIGVKYPWPKYDQIVVRDFVSGAMENTTASIFMEELRLNEREAIDSEWDYIIAHELFHQWFGDLVTAESWAHLTLNEAFANYSEYLWNEYKYGKDQADLKLVAEMEGYFEESETKKVDLIRYDYVDGEDMFDAHSYNKGGVILHMLRDVLGDEAFFAGLKDYLETNKFQAVEVHDLRLSLERVSGKDLSWFFNQWFLDKGHPELVFDVDYSQPENILVKVQQVQDLDQSPLFQFPLEVSWYEGDLRKTKKLWIDRQKAEIALENGSPVTQIYLDEEKKMLARRSQSLSNLQFVRQFRESQLGVARYEALDSLIQREAIELDSILGEAVEDSFWSIREKVLGYLYSNPEKIDDNSGLEEVIFELAEKDPKNSVRSAAIDLLGAIDSEKYHQAFRRWSRDPSYLVAGSALMAWVEGINGQDANQLEEFADEANFRMVIPLAEFYISNQVEGKGAWFRERFEMLSGEGLYYFMGYFSEYFIRNQEEGNKEAEEMLLRELRTNGKSFIRIGAFQALLGFADDEALISELKEISSSEKSLDLKKYFDYFLQMLVDEN